MSDEPKLDKESLLLEIEDNWSALNVALNEMSPEQLKGPTDAEGWTVKDHLVHLALWELSAVYLLRGLPRYEALGISRELYSGGDFDAMNAVMHKEYAHITAAAARDMLEDVHMQMMAMLATHSDADLQRPVSDFVQDGRSSGQESPAILYVYSDTAGHIEEHLPWISAIAAQPA